MESCNYCKFQSAYRNGCSTETALVKVVNDIRRAAGDSQCTVLLALDISAAFDAVDHTTLVERARTVFSINGTSLDWLRSIVTQRSQFTAVGTKRSEDLRARRCRRTILNPDKTEAVVFGTRKRLQKYRRLLDSHWLRRIHKAARCGSRCQFDVWKTCAGCRTWMPFSHQSTTAHQTTSDIGRRKDLRCSHRQ